MDSLVSEEGRGRSQRGARLGFWVLAGLGMMIFLLSSCGSDSASKDAASRKKEKAVKSGSTIQTVTPLLSPKEGGTTPALQQSDKISGMPPREELEAKRAAAARAYEKLDPKSEVLPGLTKEQLEAKIAAERAKKPDPARKILPGLTQEQLDAKLKAHRELPSTPVEILTGLTEEQAKAKAAQARQMQETKSARPEQVFHPK
jgi:hypothetical protein